MRCFDGKTGRRRCAGLLDLLEQAHEAIGDKLYAALRRMEGAEGPVRGNYENVTSVVRALEAAGVEFIPENGGGPGVRLKKGK